MLQQTRKFKEFSWEICVFYFKTFFFFFLFYFRFIYVRNIVEIFAWFYALFTWCFIYVFDMCAWAHSLHFTILFNAFITHSQLYTVYIHIYINSLNICLRLQQNALSLSSISLRTQPFSVRHKTEIVESLTTASSQRRRRLTQLPDRETKWAQASERASERNR